MIFSVITMPLMNFCTFVSVTPEGAWHALDCSVEQDVGEGQKNAGEMRVCSRFVTDYLFHSAVQTVVAGQDVNVAAAR
jgi:hypothetical protein